jgi:hypothetical protein|tara:strand:+ start:838 stop:1035 length:198 start_codon:yes stop_codon:yes gene_type:complete
MVITRAQTEQTVKQGIKKMPFKSEKQRKYLHANEPKLAKEWEKKYGKKKKKKKKKKISSSLKRNK